MPQSQFNASIADQAAADAIIAKTENLTGVKFVNINVDTNVIIVTHDDSFDEESFKSVAGI